MTYVETDCIITHEDREFESGGAYYDGKTCIAYLSREGLTTWKGEKIGTYKITKTWETPNSHISITMSQVYGQIDGVTYTGRSAGVGMVFKGRKVKR